MASERDTQRQFLAAIGAIPGTHAFRATVLRGRHQSGAVLRSLPDGTPDAYVCAGGLSVWVEFKSPTGSLRPDQVSWHRAHQAAGGIVLVCRDAADTLRDIATLCPDRDVRDALNRAAVAVVAESF